LITLQKYKEQYHKQNGKVIDYSSLQLQWNILSILYSLKFGLWKVFLYFSFSSISLIRLAIAQLTATSIKEDFIGVVQNCDTIPGWNLFFFESKNNFLVLMNSLLACLIAIEDYIQTPLPSHIQQNFTYQHTGQSRSPDHTLSTGLFIIISFFLINNLTTKSALIGSIYVVVTAFYENLTYFKFPPKYAHKLQAFVDFQV
jgi:hypothetical protein